MLESQRTHENWRWVYTRGNSSVWSPTHAFDTAKSGSQFGIFNKSLTKIPHGKKHHIDHCKINNSFFLYLFFCPDHISQYYNKINWFNILPSALYHLVYSCIASIIFSAFLKELFPYHVDTGGLAVSLLGDAGISSNLLN
jgi:hypothetical protein